MTLLNAYTSAEVPSNSSECRAILQEHKLILHSLTFTAGVISIQSMIFVDDPYYKEPGYDTSSSGR